VIWRKWSAREGLTLHYLQSRLLRRAIELLATGGRLVYSTCSLNPIEGEAVVAEALRHFGLDFVRVAPLPEWFTSQLEPRPGLTEWLVPHPNYGQPLHKGDDINISEFESTMYDHFDQVPAEHQRGGGNKGLVARTMFPPDGATEPAEMQAQMRNCGRMLPTSAGADSGGFFVAILERLRGGVPTQATQATRRAASSKPDECVAAEAAGATEHGTAAQASPEPEPEPQETEIVSEVPVDADVKVGEGVGKGSAEIREGDWQCASCHANVFERRRACFQCKTPRPQTAAQPDDGSTDDADKQGRGSAGLLPMLVSFVEPVAPVQPPHVGTLRLTADISILNGFLDAYGLIADAAAAAAANVARFPAESVRLLRRPQQRILVLVSDALDKLAISESWGP
jgi:hypothetical protein